MIYQSGIPLERKEKRRQPMDLGALAAMTRQAPVNLPDVSRYMQAPGEAAQDPRLVQEMIDKRAAQESSDAYKSIEQRMSGLDASTSTWGSDIRANNPSKSPEEIERIKEIDRQRRMFKHMIRSNNTSLQKKGFEGLSKINEEARVAPDVAGPVSAEGKKAVDEGKKYGTPEYYERVTELINAPKNKLYESSMDTALTAKDYSEWRINDPKTGELRAPLPSDAKTMGDLLEYNPIPFAKTESAKQSEAEFASAEILSSNIVDLLSTGEGDVSGLRGILDVKRSEGTFAGALLDMALNVTDNPQEQSDILLNSSMTALSNQAIAAIRGAAVGPAEQLMFQAQLPMPGQPKHVQLTNAKLTSKTLGILRRLKAGTITVDQAKREAHANTAASKGDRKAKMTSEEFYSLPKAEF